MSGSRPCQASLWLRPCCNEKNLRKMVFFTQQESFHHFCSRIQPGRVLDFHRRAEPAEEHFVSSHQSGSQVSSNHIFNVMLFCASGVRLLFPQQSGVSSCCVQVRALLPPPSSAAAGCTEMKALIAHSGPPLFSAVFVSAKRGCCHHFPLLRVLSCRDGLSLPNAHKPCLVDLIPSLIGLTLCNPAGSQHERDERIIHQLQTSSTSLPICQITPLQLSSPHLMNSRLFLLHASRPLFFPLTGSVFNAVMPSLFLLSLTEICSTPINGNVMLFSIVAPIWDLKR